MLGLLGGIGINKPRGMSVKMWCVGYLAVALGFDVLVVEIKGDGPENKFGRGNNIQDLLMKIEHRDATPSAGSAPVYGKIQLGFLIGWFDRPTL